MKRAVITGMGIISPLGDTVDSHLRAVKAQSSGIRTIRNWDVTQMTCSIAGEIDNDLLGDRWKEYDRFTRLALIAAQAAGVEAGLSEISVSPERIGVVLGSGLGGCETTDSAYERLYAKGLTRLPPLSVPKAMFSAATAAVSRELHAEGPSSTAVAACTSSNHAFATALQWIRAGMADIVIAGGTDAPLVPGIIRGWEALRVLAPSDGDPSRACRPFDVSRKGLVLAEGAAVVILEEYESALRRGATILGELAGAGMSSDAGHITDPSSIGAARAMRLAMQDAAVTPEEVGYINAHGTATKTNDPAESAAIREVFGESSATAPLVSSTKSMHGHAMGASGAIELVLSLASLNAGLVPSTLHLENADPECYLRHVTAPLEQDIDLFLSNSFGFGGVNGVVAVRTGRTA